MFNHKTGVKNKIQVWTDEIELRINEEINSEEEIFIDYGPWVKLWWLVSTFMPKKLAKIFKNNAYANFMTLEKILYE